MIMSPTIQSAGSHQTLDHSLQASFSTKPFSLSLANSKTPKVDDKSALVPRKRPHAALADESDQEDADHHEQPQLVTILGQGHGEIADRDRKNPPMVIQSQRNRDWRAESYKRRGKNILPAEEQAAREGKPAAPEEVAEDEKPQYGLVLSISKPEADEVEMRDAGTTIEAESLPIRPQSADEEALAALLGEKTTTSTLVLPAVGSSDVDDSFAGRISGEEAFRSAVAACPDSASLDAYTAVPIEEFGAALLRGMGWREGEAVGRRKNVVVTPRIVARRPALLGIGAKETPEGLEELGAWGKGAKKKAEKYHPVLLRNSKTGEMMTEEELKAKKERDEKIDADDWRARRDKNLRIDEGRKMDVVRGKPESSRDRSRSRERKRSKRDEYERRRDTDSEQDRSAKENSGKHGHDRNSSNGYSHARSSKHGERRNDEKRHDERRYDDRRREERRHSENRYEERYDDQGNASRSSSHRRRDEKRHGSDDIRSRRR